MTIVSSWATEAPCTVVRAAPGIGARNATFELITKGYEDEIILELFDFIENAKLWFPN